jgi:hypothetical protein
MPKPTKDLRPGEAAPESGQYAVIGPRGGKTNREVTAIKSKPLPPTSRPGETYRPVDMTKHKRHK